MVGKNVSHYQIRKKLGEGGMGVVYKGFDTKLQRDVAIKFLTGETAYYQEARDRFLKEAQAAAGLNHPNIATIYEIDDSGEIFIVMEYVTGENLQKRIKSGGEENALLPIETVVRYALQIAEGLKSAHRRQIVHRDIKSANIMIAAEERVKILDFGLAKNLDESNLSGSGHVVGTLAYMSPEQVLGKSVDYRTDIWSFGVVLYEMLSGQLPFPAEYNNAMIYTILYETPELLSRFRDNIPPKLIKVVEKALTKDITKRYQSFDDVLKDLRRLQQGRVQKKAPEKAEKPPIEIKDRQVMAVLPFIDLSPKKDQEYFCDGISEELIDILSRVQGWRVVSRTSSFAFKNQNVDIREIGGTLNVTHVLEGSLRKAGDRLRIQAKLSRADDGLQVWSEKYDRELADVFDIQEEIAQSIVKALQIKLGAQKESALAPHFTENFEAYNLFLKAQFHFNKRTEPDLQNGLDFCRRAIATDANFAPAYAGLADGYILLTFLGSAAPGSAMPKAKNAAQKALVMNPDFSEALTALATVQSVYEWNWQQSEKNFERAIAMNPGYSTAHHWYATNFLLPRGRFSEALSQILQAKVLDPLSPAIGASIGLTYYLMGEYDEAIRHYQDVLKDHPDFHLANLFLARAYTQVGMHREAINIFKKPETYSGNQQEMHGELAYAYVAAGKINDANKVLESLLALSKEKQLTAFSHYSLATIYARMEEMDTAFEWLEKCFSHRAPRLIYLNVDPKFAPLQTDKRFLNLLKRLK